MNDTYNIHVREANVAQSQGDRISTCGRNSEAQLAGCCEHEFIKGGEFFDYLSDY
jgi:hypothetical protein